MTNWEKLEKDVCYALGIATAEANNLEATDRKRAVAEGAENALSIILDQIRFYKSLEETK